MVEGKYVVMKVSKTRDKSCQKPAAVMKKLQDSVILQFDLCYNHFLKYSTKYNRMTIYCFSMTRSNFEEGKKWI